MINHTVGRIGTADRQAIIGIAKHRPKSDLEFVRVLEDLIATLIEKRVILLTDLPVAAQRKLSDRLDLRSQLTSLEGIVADGDDVMLP